MINNSLITKYLVFAVVVGLALKFIPQVQMSDEKIFQTVALGTLILFVIEKCFGNIFENMEGEMEMGEEIMPEEEVPSVGCNSCEPVSELPRPYVAGYVQEDHANNGLSYDNNQPVNPLLQKGQFEKHLPYFDEVSKEMNLQRYNLPDYQVHSPGYFLLNNGKFSSNGIPYEKASQVICNSKLNDLYNQHNHNIRWSPHTHVGKSRGYLNWDGVYPGA